MDSADESEAVGRAARLEPVRRLAAADGGRRTRRTMRVSGPRRIGRFVNAGGEAIPGSRGVMRATMENPTEADDPVQLDGSHGEGGGQILRTAMSLSILTGRSFRMVKVRAKRDKPGLRAQHVKAIEAAAESCGGLAQGAEVGSREVRFQPGNEVARDITIDIGTAGSTSLILQTLHLPLAMRSSETVSVRLTGGTFNPMAPAYPFMDTTWRAYLERFGLEVDLAMPAAGFYPRGGGRVEARILAGRPVSWVSPARGELRLIRGTAGVCNLREEVAQRMRRRASRRFEAYGVDAEIDLVQWPGPGQGAAISLTAEYEGTVPATFVGLGERGKPAEAVADEAVNAWLAFENAAGAAVDPHSADQILLPLALAEGPSEYSVSEVTEHLRTNARTIHAFLERKIRIEEGEDGGGSGRVFVE